VTSYAIISTYPPTQCGLATFSAALASHLMTVQDEIAVVSSVDEPTPDPSPGVRYQWARSRRDQAPLVADLVNQTHVALIQHEYGIYGGPDGVNLLDVVRRLRVPSIVTLHTVLTAPSRPQREILEELAATASMVVTMTRAARDRLVANYAVDPAQVRVVPHGAPDRWPRLDRPQTPRRMLSWGLLGPGKGIEWAIRALPELRDLDVVYDVVGETHPRVAAASGEAYRESLRALAERLGLAERVRFEGRYLTAAQLRPVVASADLVLLPYESREQVTSGVLVEAVAAGRAVISTDFPHARELLGGGVGLLVPPRDPAAIAAAVRRVLTEPGLADMLRRRASRLAPSLAWASVGEAYRGLAAEAVDRRALAS
jgi:glycosyltransferase involved in cell wall biosynthesis